MKICAPNSIHTNPSYRLVYHPRSGFSIILFSGKPNTTYYGEPDELPTLIANTTSKEAALAVLRLFDIDQYEDWTNK